MSNLAFDRAEAVANLAVEYSKVLVAVVSDDNVVHTSFGLAERMVAEIERRFDDVKAKVKAEEEAKAREKMDRDTPYFVDMELARLREKLKKPKTPFVSIEDLHRFFEGDSRGFKF